MTENRCCQPRICVCVCVCVCVSYRSRDVRADTGTAWTVVRDVIKSRDPVTCYTCEHWCSSDGERKTT